MGSDMDAFKKQLEELKRKGANIDPDQIVSDMTTLPEQKVVEEFESSFDRKAFQLMKQKVIKLLEDYEKFYGPKGRGLSVAMHVQKDDCADRFSETFNYIPDKLSIVNIVDIGTKGKYEGFDVEAERKWVEEHNKMVEEEKKRVEEKEKRLGREV
jgi:hypothetical protein